MFHSRLEKPKEVARVDGMEQKSIGFWLASGKPAQVVG